MQQSRKQKKLLKAAFRERDIEAARLLLAHSVALGHRRLGLRRYLAARYLGVTGIDEFRPFCADVACNLTPETLLMAASATAGELHLDVDIHAYVSELIVAATPLILPYAGVAPKLSRGPQYCGAHVSLLGRLEIGENPWFGPISVIRGDGHFVRIGDDFRIGARSTTHISHGLYPVIIGNRVTVGENCVIHACTVGDDCVIEDGVIVLDGATLEDGVIVDACTTVFPRSTLKSGWLYAGSPAKPVRKLEPGEQMQRRQAVSRSIFASIINNAKMSWTQEVERGRDAFIAETTRFNGIVRVGDGTGIFFGCRFDGSVAGIEIGSHCNIQDNSVIDAADGVVAIGECTTIGHNAHLRACRIGSRSLIGIGSNLAAGTVVEDDVLLAAGAATLPGQHLQKGWLWGGRPARPIAKLDQGKRAMMSATIRHYATYAADYATSQRLKNLGRT